MGFNCSGMQEEVVWRVEPPGIIEHTDAYNNWSMYTYTSGMLIWYVDDEIENLFFFMCFGLSWNIIWLAIERYL